MVLAGLLAFATGNANARWLSVDPVQADANTGQNFNRYWYANNNPYKFTDPDGRQVRELNFETQRSGYQPPPRSPDDKLGPAIGAALTGVLAAPVAGFALTNPAMATTVTNVVADSLAGEALGGASLTAGASAAATTAANAPDFVVSAKGTAFPVPKGATGPTPVTSPAGKQTGAAFTGGKGGANGQVSTMRMMDPTPPRGASPGYPNGYIKYENASKQGVDSYSGKTLPNSQSHHEL